VPESQTNRAWDVLLDVRSPTGGPLHERLTAALRAAIRRRDLTTGDLLPPSRSLAADLGCSRWAVTEAYGRLTAEGYLEARTGSGTRVCWTGDGAPAPDATTAGPRDTAAPRFDLVPGLPDLRAFPRRRWSDAVAAAAASAAFTELGHPAAEGHLRLRDLLAAYLRRSRHAVTTPADLTVCTSVTDGVARLCRVLLAEGITAIGCEEPGWTRLRTVIRAAGLDPVPIGTDALGIRVDELAARPGLRAVLVTPAHQFPAGTVLAPERRAALLRWARDADGVVVEDDYDAEFRYDRRPVATLQGMDPARVVLAKSLSKTLSPALGIGWIATPPRWTARLRASGHPEITPPVLDQLAFAALLESGDYPDRGTRSHAAAPAGVRDRRRPAPRPGPARPRRQRGGRQDRRHRVAARGGPALLPPDRRPRGRRARPGLRQPRRHRSRRRRGRAAPVAACRRPARRASTGADHERPHAAASARSSRAGSGAAGPAVKTTLVAPAAPRSRTDLATRSASSSPGRPAGGSR
jgi:GntR family transcriptional regulator / MocR family aminotransferase